MVEIDEEVEEGKLEGALDAAARRRVPAHPKELHIMGNEGTGTTLTMAKDDVDPVEVVDIADNESIATDGGVGLQTR